MLGEHGTRRLHGGSRNYQPQASRAASGSVRKAPIFTQELRSEFAIDDPVIERQTKCGDLPNLDLAFVYPRCRPDGPEHQDRRLAGREDRCAGVDAEHADVGDREGATADVGRCRLTGLRGLHQPGHGVRQFAKGEPAGVLDVGHDQATLGCGRDAEIHVLLHDDLARIAGPGRVDHRVAMQRGERGSGHHEQW